MLFKDSEELRQHAETNGEIDMRMLRPTQLEAANTYIKPAIGEAFFMELLQAHELGGATQAQHDAIYYLQDALGPYLLLLAAPKNMVSFSNAGLTEYASGEESQTRQWVLAQYMQAQLRAGDTALDYALAFLEANKDQYPTWRDSEAYTISKELFFENVHQLADHVNVIKGRRTYLALRPFIRRAERRYLKPTLGEDLYKTLKDQLKAGTLSEDNQELIEEYIRPALGPLSLLLAIPELSLEMSEEGIRFKSYNDTIRQRQAASDNDKGALFRSLDTNGEAELAELKTFLLKNADTYQDFKTSQTYLDRQGGELPCNDSNAKCVIV